MKRRDQKQIIIRITEDMHKKLKLKVIEDNTSVQEVLEKAIKEYLDKDK